MMVQIEHSNIIDALKHNLDVETWLPEPFKLLGSIVPIGILINRGLCTKLSKRYIYPNIYAMFVGSSGTGKGVIIDNVIREIVETIDRDLVLADTGTPEAILKRLSQKGQRTIMTDEATTVLSQREYMKDMSNYLTLLYNAHRNYITIDRVKNNRSYVIERPYLNVVLGVQPELLKKIVGFYDIAAGFMQRFFIVIGEAQRPKQTDDDLEGWEYVMKVASQIYNTIGRLEDPIVAKIGDPLEIIEYAREVQHKYDSKLFSRWIDLTLKLCCILHVNNVACENMGELEISMFERIPNTVIDQAIGMMESFEKNMALVDEYLSKTRDTELIERYTKIVHRLIDKDKYVVLDGRVYIYRRDILRYAGVTLSKAIPYLEMLRENDILGEVKTVNRKVLYHVPWYRPKEDDLYD